MLRHGQSGKCVSRLRHRRQLTYVITGNKNTAAFISFQVVNCYYGESGQTPVSVGVIDSNTLRTDENGNFTITPAREGADGGPNTPTVLPKSGSSD